MKDQIHVLNATDFEYGGYGAGNAGEKYVNSVPRPANGGIYIDTSNNSTMNRTKRNEPLLDRDNGDQVLIDFAFKSYQVPVESMQANFLVVSF